MERVDNEGQIATAFTLARILNGLPTSIHGPAKLVIFDIHALQERFYFSDSVIPVMASAVPLFLTALRQHHADQPLAVAFPDEGAQKRFGRDFDATIPQVLCSKVRDGDKRVVRVKEGNPAGLHVFIVDDLVKTGGTLLECMRVLFAAGATAVSAFVTHAVFPQDSWKRFLPTEDKRCFSTFYVTDTCPSMAAVLRERGSPFVVLPIAKQLSEIVLQCN